MKALRCQAPPAQGTQASFCEILGRTSRAPDEGCGGPPDPAPGGAAWSSVGYPLGRTRPSCEKSICRILLSVAAFVSPSMDRVPPRYICQTRRIAAEALWSCRPPDRGCRSSRMNLSSRPERDPRLESCCRRHARGLARLYATRPGHGPRWGRVRDEVLGHVRSNGSLDHVGHAFPHYRVNRRGGARPCPRRTSRVHRASLLGTGRRAASAGLRLCLSLGPPRPPVRHVLSIEVRHADERVCPRPR